MHNQHSTRVRRIFEAIAPRYDAFNTIASFGRDESWRKRAVSLAAPSRIQHALDAATGTGKIAASLLSCADTVTGLDFTHAMLANAGRYLAGCPDGDRAGLVQGDILKLPFGPNTFDCITVGFGVRNLADIQLGLGEFHRVLKPGGRLVILDIVKPIGLVQTSTYTVLFRWVLPLIGWALSGNREAYQYLPDSVETYLQPQDLTIEMCRMGFTGLFNERLFLGAIAIHLGIKKPDSP